MSGDVSHGIDDAALERRVAEMSDAAFARLVERTRPPKIGEMSYRQVRESITRKSNALQARMREEEARKKEQQ